MRLSLLVAALTALAVGGGVRAQPVPDPAELAWTNVPLSQALYELAEATGLELVFAIRLVEDVRVYGRYRVTDDPDRALRLLLRGTGIRAERIRSGQYVLIREPPNVTAEVETAREAYTGTLDGRVVDVETGVALPGAHVWLIDLGLGDVVAADGAFAVPNLPTGRYVVRVSHVGYRPVRLELDVFPDSPRLPPTIRLQQVTVEVPDADILAGPAPPGPTPGMTEIGTRQAAAIPYALGETDLAATLSWLPGLGRTGGASGALVVRGADPHRTRYVRDGVPLYEPWHAFGLFSSFQPESLGRVRFHRGSLPASLGGGLAAVLDVETTDALAGDTLRLAGLGAVAGRALADIALGDRVGLHLGAQRSTLGALLRPTLRLEGNAWILDPTGGSVLEAGRPSVSFGDAEAKLSVRLDGGQVDVSASVGGDDLEVALPVERGARDYAWRTHTASARLRALVGARTFVTLQAYRSGHGMTERRTEPVRVEAEQALTENGVVLDVDHFRSLRHQVRGGIQIASRAVDGVQPRGSASVGEQRVLEAAAYLEDTWRPGGGWQLQPGLRAEIRSSGGQASSVDLSPRLFARWAADEDRLVVRAGVSRQTQAVHRLRGQIGGRYQLATSRWLLADGEVPISRAWQVGVGTEWAATDHLAFSADLYARRSRSLLEPLEPGRPVEAVAPPDLIAAFPRHRGRAHGLEVAARYQASRWTVGLSGALARAQVRREGGAWRPSTYDRPVSVGVLAQRRWGPWTAALRLDLESGLARPGGGRDGLQVRASGAVGATTAWRGLQLSALAQATARPPTSRPASVPMDAGLPLATDARGLPGWPVVTVSARW